MRLVLATSLVPLLAALQLAGCASNPEVSDEIADKVSEEQAALVARDYAGEVEVYLLPYEEQGACSITVGLRNTSGVRMAVAWFQLAWLDGEGQLLAEQSLRMDGLLPGRYDAKNLSLPLRCAQVSRLDIKSANWTLFQGWDNPLEVVVPITGAHGTGWRLRWNAELEAFAGERLSGAPDES